MDFPKLNAPSLKELFVRELEHMILSGKLAVGVKLPSERELASSMQVSRAVVNAGLSEMAAKGFVEIRPRAGVYVADFRRRGTIDTLLSIMRYNGGVLRKSEIRSLLELRLVMENLAMELAIPRLTQDDVQRLGTLCDSFGASEDDPERAAAFVFEFHHELCVLSGNTLLPLIFYSFREPVISLWERYLRLHGVARLHKNTADLFDCIRRRDLAAAVDCFTSSIRDTIEGGASIYFDQD